MKLNIEKEKNIFANTNWPSFYNYGKKLEENICEIDVLSFSLENVTILKEQEICDSFLASSKDTFGKIDSNGYSFWIYIVDNCWQNDSKILNYYKLWKRIEISNDLFPIRSKEIRLEHNKKIKFSGFVKIEKKNFLSAICYLLKHHTHCFIIASNNENITKDEKIKEIFCESFPEQENVINIPNLVYNRCSHSNIIISIFTDTTESSLDFYASTKDFSSLY